MGTVKLIDDALACQAIFSLKSPKGESTNYKAGDL
jgi:hypothetical protein